MKIICYHNNQQHQKSAITRFEHGILRHGPVDLDRRHYKEILDCDLAVFWGHRFVDVIERQKKNGARYLVMERAYIGDRFYWTSLGFDGLNGRATFPAIQDGGERWKKWFQFYEQPWNARYADVAVIMGQVQGDQSIQGVDFIKWANEKAAWLRKNFYVVIFRPHPLARDMQIDAHTHRGADLADALKSAAVVFTFNSNSGVDSIMAGVPAIADDPGSMIYGLCSLKNLYPDRTAWEQKMSYTQWRPDEIENGDAWAALRTVL